MKKMKIAILASTIVATSVVTANELADKLANFYTIMSNRAIEFKAEERDSKYIIKLLPKNDVYKELFDKNASFTLNVDEGPIIFEPKFTIGKAGIYGDIDVINLFDREIREDAKRNLQSIKVDYKAIVSFSNIIRENIEVKPIKIKSKETDFSISPIRYHSEINLDNFTGSLGININNIKIEDNTSKSKGLIAIDNLIIKNNLTEPPVDGIFIFSKSSVAMDSVEIKSDKKGIKFKFNTATEILKIDNSKLNIFTDIDLSSDDVNTILLTRGIKELDTSIKLRSLGTKGLIELVKVSEEMNRLEREFRLKGQTPDITAQYLAKMGEISGKLVTIFNQIVKKDETRLELDVKVFDTATSFIKLNLVYKADPLQGDVNSATISLLSKGLAIFDGTFDIQVSRNLAVAINPFATIVLDMLKNKGLVSENGGIYTLKGELKDGKIVINGKAYTIEELSKVLF